MFNRDFVKKFRAGRLLETGCLTLKTQKLRSFSMFVIPTAENQVFLTCNLFQDIYNYNFLSDTMNSTPNITFFEVFNYDFLKTGCLIETGRLILVDQNLRLSSMFNRDLQ